MRRVNVIKAFNFCHPDGRIQPFGVGLHEMGTYKKPVWNRELDKPVDGKFEKLEIAEHSYVKRHCGKMPTAEELRAEAKRLEQQAAELAAQAKVSEDDSGEAAAAEPEAKPDAPKLDVGNRVAANTRTK